MREFQIAGEREGHSSRHSICKDHASFSETARQGDKALKRHLVDAAGTYQANSEYLAKTVHQLVYDVI